MNTRLQKLLAEAGLGSRRGCEDMLRAGRVTVNGKPASLGDSADPGTDEVALDGHAIGYQHKEYWLLNKPLGVLSAVVDGRGRPTVTDCVPAGVRVFPVGRLDLNSTGVLILTNDGELTDRLLHPRYHVDKEYIAMVRGEVAEPALAKLRQGVALEDGVTSAAVITVVQVPSAGNGSMTALKVTIHEGRKRQVRRMFEAVGYRVSALHRNRFATLTDQGLPIGEARRLSIDEVAALRRLAGLV